MQSESCHFFVCFLFLSLPPTLSFSHSLRYQKYSGENQSIIHFLNILESFCWHLQIVVLFSFWQLGEIHQAWMLPLIIISYLWEKEQSWKQYFNFLLLPATLVHSNSKCMYMWGGLLNICIWNTQPRKSVSLTRRGEWGLNSGCCWLQW